MTVMKSRIHVACFFDVYIAMNIRHKLEACRWLIGGSVGSFVRYVGQSRHS